MPFSSEEKRDMIKIFYFLNRNSVLSQQRYFELYPERQQPDRTLFANLDKNLSEYGSFAKPKVKYGRRLTLENKENILQAVSAKISIF